MKFKFEYMIKVIEKIIVHYFRVFIEKQKPSNELNFI